MGRYIIVYVCRLCGCVLKRVGVLTYHRHITLWYETHGHVTYPGIHTCIYVVGSCAPEERTCPCIVSTQPYVLKKMKDKIGNLEESIITFEYGHKRLVMT